MVLLIKVTRFGAAAAAGVTPITVNYLPTCTPLRGVMIKNERGAKLIDYKPSPADAV